MTSESINQKLIFLVTNRLKEELINEMISVCTGYVMLMIQVKLADSNKKEAQ